jgi:DNA repair exonuclease SbcCD ATPase subunit
MAKTSATKKQLESDLRDSLDQLRASLDSVKVFLDAAANKKRLPGKTLAARRGEWKEIEESITSLETKVSAGELQSATENVIQVRSQLSHLDKELAKVAATHHTVGAKKTGRKI